MNGNATATAVREPLAAAGRHPVAEHHEILDAFRYRFGRDQAERMIESGLFGDDRVEWIDGEFYQDRPVEHPPGAWVPPPRTTLPDPPPGARLRDFRDEHRYRFSREQADRLTAEMVFGDDRVEWIGGEFYRMASISRRHATITDEIRDLLTPILDGRGHVQSQNPIAALHESLPEPDVAVIPGRRRDQQDDHPTAYLLVVEVALTSYAFDRGLKYHRYAASGVPDYWIVDLNADRIEVFRDPVADPEAVQGFRYASESVLSPGQTLRPLFADEGVALAVADLLLLAE